LSECAVWALTFERINLSVCRYIFRVSRSRLHMKVITSRSQKQRKRVCVSC